MRVGDTRARQLIRKAIEQGGRDSIEGVIKAVESTDAIDYTARLARKETEQATTALSDLPESPYKDALISLAEFSVNRTY